MKTKRIIVAFGVMALTMGSAGPVFAQNTPTTASTVELQVIIDQLKVQIAELQARLQDLATVKNEVREAQQDVRSTLRLARQLRQGMTGDDVRLLQEVLSTDADIYPEGLVTGFFGPLTAKAVGRLQAKVGLEQVGQVGPKTMAQINRLLANGAGKSGKVPPGLLRAPGILKKLGPNNPGDNEPDQNAVTIEADHSFVNGVHTVSGSINLPTPCHGLEHSVVIMESFPEQVRINLLITPPSLPEDTVCTTVIDPREFTVTFEASENAQITAYVDGVKADLVLNEISDTTAPVITGVSVASTTASSTRLLWSTDEEASSMAWASTSTPILVSESPNVSISTLVKDHSLKLEGLMVSTTYYFVVGSVDEFGNRAVSGESSFMTEAETE